VNEIVSSLNVDDADATKRLDAMCARVALLLDSFHASPIKDRILTVAQEKNHSRCLTLTSLADGIAENNLLGSLYRAAKGGEPMIVAGPLAEPSLDSKLTMNKAVETLSRFYTLFSTNLEAHWALGDDKGGFLCTNLGLRAITQLLRRLIAFIERKDSVSASTLDPEDVVDRVKSYAEPVIDFFKTASPNDIGRFRNRGSSLQSVDQNCMQMMAIIHSAKGNEFDSVEVREWVQNQDAEGTKQARELIDEINRILYKDVIDTLKAKYGESEREWWMKGVPPKVRVDCDRLFNETTGEHARWQFLFLINYVDIILYGDNWDLFKDHYDFYGKGKKADRPRWIVKVNKARQIAFHAEKGPLSRDQVEFVRRVHFLVKEFIGQRKPIVAGHAYLQDQETTT
jgi:hypothetical protein